MLSYNIVCSLLCQDFISLDILKFTWFWYFSLPLFFFCQISSLRCDHLEDLLLVSILASVLITSPTKMGFEMLPLNFSHNSFFSVLLTSAFEIINFLLIVKFFHLDLCSITHLLLKLLALSDICFLTMSFPHIWVLMFQ